MEWIHVFVIFLVGLQLCRAQLDWWAYKQLSWMNRRRMLQLQSQMITDMERRLCRAQLDWWAYKQLSWMNRRRMLQLQSQMITDMERRIAAIQPIRFMYEESPHYEIGYVLGEIMERYRKMVDTVHRVNKVPDALFHTLRNLQQQQNYYQEGYNLICMLHEIPRKYAHIEEFAGLADTVVDDEDMKELIETYEQQKVSFEALVKHRNELKKAKKTRVKQMKKNQAVGDLLKSVYGKDFDIDKASPERLKKLPTKNASSPKSVTPWGRLYEYGWDLNFEWWWK